MSPAESPSGVNHSITRWEYKKWQSQERETSNPSKESLLRASLDLIRDEPENEAACRKIVEAALEARLIGVAIDAVRAFSPDADYDLCASVTKVFEMRYWRHITKEFATYCERRILAAPECRSCLKWGSDPATELRSKALGYLGQRRYFLGDVAGSYELWGEADEPFNVSEVMSEMCLLIAAKAPKHMDAAMALLETIPNKIIKSKTLTALASYV